MTQSNAPQSPNTGAIPSQSDNGGATQDDTNVNKTPHSVTIGTTNVNSMDDVNIKFFNQGFRLGQIQLVSELLEQKQMYTIGEDDSSEEYDYEAIPIEVLKHKKQELEGKYNG